MSQIISIPVGVDVKLLVTLKDINGDSINAHSITELFAYVYNASRIVEVSNMRIIGDDKLEILLKSGVELTGEDQETISIALRYKSDDLIHSTSVVEIMHRGWVGEFISNDIDITKEHIASFVIQVPPSVYYAGASPRIGLNGNWWVFDDDAKMYIDSKIPVDYTKNDPVIYRGPFVLNEEYFRNNEVTHMGCMWRCNLERTFAEPKWNERTWTMIVGNQRLSIEFNSSNGFAFYKGNVNTIITPVCLLGYLDISKDIHYTDWKWERVSHDPDGDKAWNTANAANGRILHLRNQDMPDNWSITRKVQFVCTAYVRYLDDTYEVINKIIA